MAFLLTPLGPVIDPFPLAEQRIYAESYAYYLWEHLAWITVSYVLMVEVPKHRPFLKAFLFLNVFDMVDYMLTYNSIWFKVWFIPVSFNVVSFLFMVMVFINEAKWNRR
jgi:hypothetical protein